MKIVLQRVLKSSVEVDGKLVSKISNGFLALVGIHADDTKDCFDSIIKKIISLRVFPDSSGKMNLSLLDNNYEILLVSQFTLYADCSKGNRPSFIKAMRPDMAKDFYNDFVSRFKELYSSEKVKDGIFAADMKVSLINDGPVTIVL